MEYSASEAGQGEESQTAMANALNPTATLAMSNQAGNTPARSYLDTVVGNGTEHCPSCPKGGELGESDRTNAVEEPDQNQDATHTVTNVGGEAVARPSTKGAHPYGSWMIATRRERRQQGGQGGRPNEGAMQRATNGKGKEGATGTGSRFALLENAEDNEGPEPQVETDATGNPTTDSRAKGLGGKSKRANVIVNEKQIQNEARSPRVEPETSKESTQGRRVTGSSSRHAAEEDEHVVSRGVQGGKVIRSTVVHTGDSNGADVPEAIPSDYEHHEDPPSGFDHEGDVIMDDDSPQAVAEATGGDKRSGLKGASTGKLKERGLTGSLHLSAETVFPEASVTHTESCLYHASILVRTTYTGDAPSRPFRFQVGTVHPGERDPTGDAMSPPAIFVLCFRKLSTCLHEWIPISLGDVRHQLIIAVFGVHIWVGELILIEVKFASTCEITADQKGRILCGEMARAVGVRIHIGDIDLLEDYSEARSRQKVQNLKINFAETMFAAMESLSAYEGKLNFRRKLQNRQRRKLLLGLDYTKRVGTERNAEHCLRNNDMHAGEVYGEKAIWLLK
nr:uncharacterized protein LOC109158503 [Ipomoea batatas]